MCVCDLQIQSTPRSVLCTAANVQVGQSGAFSNITDQNLSLSGKKYHSRYYTLWILEFPYLINTNGSRLANASVCPVDHSSGSINLFLLFLVNFSFHIFSGFRVIQKSATGVVKRKELRF